MTAPEIATPEWVDARDELRQMCNTAQRLRQAAVDMRVMAARAEEAAAKAETSAKIWSDPVGRVHTDEMAKIQHELTSARWELANAVGQGVTGLAST